MEITRVGKENPSWCEYPNICQYVNCRVYKKGGYTCVGYVKKKLAHYPKGDVISICDTYRDEKTKSDDRRHDVMTVNEALAEIELLSAAIHRFNLREKRGSKDIKQGKGKGYS